MLTLTLAERTRKFWCAAYFYRRAPDRDRSLAVRVLEQVNLTATGKVQFRADALLREIDSHHDHQPASA